MRPTALGSTKDANNPSAAASNPSPTHVGFTCDDAANCTDGVDSPERAVPEGKDPRSEFVNVFVAMESE